jgi:hypothetical protein
VDDSEARAALWREQRQRRVQYQAALLAALRGDTAAWTAFWQLWLPLIDWTVERAEPPVPVEDELDPLGISDQVNVGT